MNISIALIFIFSFLLNFPSTMIAQQSKVRLSLKAGATQRLGVDTDITIDYSRPGVKGRKYGVNWYPTAWHPVLNSQTRSHFPGVPAQTKTPLSNSIKTS